MLNTWNLFSLLKPTLSFVLNRKLLVYLTAFPVLILTALSFLTMMYPPAVLAETVRPSLEFNYGIIFLNLFFFTSLFLSLMQHVQQILFFGPKIQKRKYFLPQPDNALGRYVFVFFQILFVSLFLSAFLSYAVLLVVKRYFPVSEQIHLYAVIGTLFFMPYFFMRFILKLPATAAKRTMNWGEAWMKSRRISVMVLMFLMMFLFIPGIFFFGFCAFIQTVFGSSIVITGVICALLMFYVLRIMPSAKMSDSGFATPS